MFCSKFVKVELLIRFDAAIIWLYKASLNSIILDGYISVMVFQSSLGCLYRECYPILNTLLFTFYVKYSKFVFLVYLSFNNSIVNQAICQFCCYFDSRTVASRNVFCHLRGYHVCLIICNRLVFFQCIAKENYQHYKEDPHGLYNFNPSGCFFITPKCFDRF